MLRVAFGWATKAVFLGGQDFSPSIIEQILVSLKLLLLLFQAPCSCYELALEVLLLQRFLRHDENVGAEAHLILGERKINSVL